MSEARRQFGKQASHYVTSGAHARGASLDLLAEWAAVEAGERVLDIATGTGFAAFALAVSGGLVVATDITREMLEQARRLAAQRGLTNVSFAFGAAEELPFGDGRFDVVACRVAAHHFADVPRFVAEAYRVCRPGGRTLLVDTVAPEDQALAELMNELERRRDSSHVRNYSPAQWQTLFEAAGFFVPRRAVVKTELEFEDWVRRSGTPADEVTILRRMFAEASPEAAAAFQIRDEGGQLRFAWDTVVLEARKPG